MTHFLVALAEAHGEAGHPESGLPLTDEALGMLERNGNRYYEPEAWRVRGEILWQLARAGRAGAGQPAPRGHDSSLTCLQHARDLARRRGARAFELRAATAIARLWHAEGRTAAARRLLAPHDRWFREGADTLDLRTARALLADLSRQPPA